MNNVLRIFFIFLFFGCRQSKKEENQYFKKNQYFSNKNGDIHSKKTLDYIDKYSGLAVHEMDFSGIPASVILATAIVASKSGTTVNSMNSKNHFQMKCFTIHDKKKINKHCKLIGKFQYRIYNTVAESFREHTKLQLFTNKDYVKWCMILKHPKLVYLIEDYQLNKLDNL